MPETPAPQTSVSPGPMAALGSDPRRQAIHDLRGSLSALSTAARLLELSPGDAEQTRKTANLIRRQVRTIEQQIAQLSALFDPTTPVHSPALATPALPQGSTEADTSEIPLRVLVVDDDRAAAHLLKRLLEKLGCLVETANDGEAALAMLTPFAPELVISDVEMPGMSGDSLAREIRSRNPEPRPLLVALSGHVQLPTATGRDSGFDHVLLKPADAEVLERLVATARSFLPEAATRSAC